MREQPRFTSAIRLRVAACAHLGRAEEAREWLKRLLKQQPGLTVTGLTEFWTAISMATEIVDLWVEGFRKAGLPEE